MKTIVHFIYRLDTGGLEQVLFQTISGLPKYKHVIISLTSKTAFADNFANSVDIICLNKQPGNSIGIYFQVYKLLCSIKPDVFHSYNLAGIEFQPIAFFAGINKRIQSEHGTGTKYFHQVSKTHNFIRYFCSKFCHRVITVNEKLALWLKQDVHVKSDKIKLIENGIDINKYQESSLTRDNNSNEIRFGSVARLAPEKDQTTLIRAFAHLLLLPDLPKKELTLEIWGDGQLKNELVSLCKELGVLGSIHFKGVTNNVPKALAQFDVFVLSSNSEAMPMTILEAMASSLPIISTRVGNIPEHISKSDAGILVDVGDIHQLAGAMKEFANNVDYRLAVGILAQKYAKKTFGQEKMLAGYDGIYSI